MTSLRVSNEQVLADIEAELARARAKFPGNAMTFHALAEEQGELAQALLNLAHGKGTHGAIYVEAVQVAAMAIRVATEGEAGSDYEPETGYRRVL